MKNVDFTFYRKQKTTPSSEQETTPSYPTDDTTSSDSTPSDSTQNLIVSKLYLAFLLYYY